MTMYTIKLPVPTAINNAQLLLDIILITPAMLRTEFYKLVEPKLHLMLKEWNKLPPRLTLIDTYDYPVARMALVQVALLIHASFPTMGLPEEVLAKPNFSLSRPSDHDTRQQQLLLAHRLNQAGARTGWSLYQHLLAFDTEIIQKVSSDEKVSISCSAPPAMLFAIDPQLCYMPVYLEEMVKNEVSGGKTESDKNIQQKTISEIPAMSLEEVKDRF